MKELISKLRRGWSPFADEISGIMRQAADELARRPIVVVDEPFNPEPFKRPALKGINAGWGCTLPGRYNPNPTAAERSGALAALSTALIDTGAFTRLLSTASDSGFRMFGCKILTVPKESLPANCIGIVADPNRPNEGFYLLKQPDKQHDS